MQTEATTPNSVGPRMLGVVASVLAMVWKRTKNLSTISGPAVHRGKDTTHKTFETICNARGWPQQCWKSCANGSIKRQKKCWELLVRKFDRFQTLRYNSQHEQHGTTCNSVYKRTQQLTSNNAGSCWPSIMHPHAWSLTLTIWAELFKAGLR